MIGRRLALAGAGALGGCGFRPLYMPEAGGVSAAGAALAQVYVPVIGERAGQLLRQALQARIDGAGSSAAKTYELIANPAIAGEGIAILRDSSTTRIRLSATGPWTLRRLDPARTVLASGSSRIVDGYNIINAQYFAAELEGEAATKRICDALADQIVTQVAIFLKRQAEPPKPA